MWRRRPRDAVAFLTGLAAGEVLAALVVSLVVATAGNALQATMSHQIRVVLFAVLATALGVADIAGKTPHVWRQVPQQLFWRLPPGPLGLVWGFDLGLLVTTQKVVSLIWVAVIGVALLEPGSAPWLLILMAVIACVSVAVLSRTVAALSDKFGNSRERQWVKRIRIGSGVTIIALAAIQLALM
jgi:hypothetical protein